jgi:YD repeat-containing protein
MAIEALNTLFPFTTDTGLFSTNFPFEIVLPDTSTYEIYYDSYGNISRIELPTGGAYEYGYG